ncbi:hypothetical protein HDE68_002774 [Pedobacter cryoconitis]|uniref:eCIS core domain-containing protein n=1 Tax=Pedobacter cryoconitis TaxID=188932 RepID=A0A7W9DZD8_9SPHI|nr:DUF4157 domain-containing protein [Pedobacter cryoconitis]MBB5636861.1 hypothetical protein [Pedobacter cryoconitis]
MSNYANENREKKGQSLSRNVSQRKKENNTGLPDNLKSGIENLSSYSLDDVKVHYNSDKPSQLQAHAYAQGTDIHLAPGQEKHLPHEAWHVVQQKQGRVEPTMQLKGQVNVNDDAGLEKEADVMGAKAFQFVNYQLKAVEPASNPNSLQKGVVQAAMADLTRIQKERFKKSDKGKYTTVGFEIDVLTTNAGNPIQGMSHLVVGKGTAPFAGQSLGYQLETDAGNVLEMVTPPYLIEKNENGVLNAADLIMVVGHLKQGYDAAQNSIDSIPKPGKKANVNAELANITNSVSGNFDAGLTPQAIKIYNPLIPPAPAPAPPTTTIPPPEVMVNETHMSPKANLNTLINSLAGKNNIHITAGAGPAFNPQLNIFTSVQNYDALSASTESRLDKLNDFKHKEAKDITDVKVDLITRLRTMLVDVSFKTSIDFLEYTLKVLDPRRTALAIQKSGQDKMFSDKAPLTGTKAAEFNEAASDVSYVKDQKGVWLKTDVYNYIVKSLYGDQTKINEFGNNLKSVYDSLNLVTHIATRSWVLGLSHLYNDLKLFEASNGNRPTPALEKDWGGATFFTSDTVLGIRHDTLLKEEKVKECYEMLNRPGSYNFDDGRVLVELRNMGFVKGDTITEINDKLTAFLAAWEGAL